VPVLISGDVHARAWVRIQEVRESIRIIRKFLEDMPEGDIAVPLALPGLICQVLLLWRVGVERSSTGFSQDLIAK